MKYIIETDQILDVVYLRTDEGYKALKPLPVSPMKAEEISEDETEQQGTTVFKCHGKIQYRRAYGSNEALKMVEEIDSMAKPHGYTYEHVDHVAIPKKKEVVEDWSIPKDGKIDVPDELMPLFNKIGFQFRFVQYSGKDEIIAIAHIIQGAQKFFSENPHLLNSKS